ncbi:MAG TPA: alpha-L-fucosidase [Pedobacter sp.]|nr:alpha-L-fucosidase [Pedobacter sp.]
MKRIIFLLLTIAFAQPLFAQNDTTKLAWFKDAKFGLFLHWGLYSQTAGDWNGHPTKGGEHFMLYERIPLKTYAKIADDFNPTAFNADLWVKTAKEAGMKYIVFTAKHHDGFAMYNSPSSDYNIVKRTEFKRDPIAELAVACKKYGLKLCLYYSLGRDWQDPDVPTNWPDKAGRSNSWDYPNEDAKVFNRYFERKVKPQITELLTQYGPIAVVWFDTAEMISKKESIELKNLVNTLQPNCLVNNRIGNGIGDFSISEQTLTPASKKAWESCITIGQNWGYNKHDSVWKTPEMLVRNLVDVVANGGNLLLNIGPMGNGNFPKWATTRLTSIGKWMDVNSEAITNTKPWVKTNEASSKAESVPTMANETNTMKDAVHDGTPKSTSPDIYFTTKEKTIYVFLRSWTSPNFQVKSINKNLDIKSIVYLGSTKKVKWDISENGLTGVLPGGFKKVNAVPVYVLKVNLN